MTTLEFSPDGSLLVAAGGRGGLGLWDVTGSEPARLPVWRERHSTSMRYRRQRWREAARAARDWTPGQVTDIECASFRPDGLALAVGGYYVLFDDMVGCEYKHWAINLLDPSSGVALDDPIVDDEVLPTDNKGNDGLVCLAFGPGGDVLATGDTDGTVGIWDVTGRRAQKTFLVRGRSALACAFSPDGATLATAVDEFDFYEGIGAVELWDLTRNSRKSRMGEPLVGHTGSATAVAFGLDGEHLATAGADGLVWVWDTRTRKESGEPLIGHGGRPVAGVTFSPDGRMLATAGADGTARLWDAGTRAQLGEPLVGHGAAAVAAVAFSPRGDRLATGDSAGTARLFDLGPTDGRRPGRP